MAEGMHSAHTGDAWELQSAEFVPAPPIPTAGNIGQPEVRVAVVVTKAVTGGPPGSVTVGSPSPQPHAIHVTVPMVKAVVLVMLNARATRSGLSGTEAKHCQ